jgi:hypothetical protein
MGPPDDSQTSPGSGSYQPDADPHQHNPNPDEQHPNPDQPDTNQHQPDPNQHQPDPNQHQPDPNQHQPDPNPHQPNSDPDQPDSDMNPPDDPANTQGSPDRFHAAFEHFNAGRLLEGVRCFSEAHRSESATDLANLAKLLEERFKEKFELVFKAVHGVCEAEVQKATHDSAENRKRLEESIVTLRKITDDITAAQLASEEREKSRTQAPQGGQPSRAE